MKKQIMISAAALLLAGLANAQQLNFDGLNAIYGYPKPVTWFTSNWGAGFGHKIYNDDYNGKTYLKIAGRHNAASFTDIMTVSSDGLVGIGTNAPTMKLELFDATTNLSLLKLRNNAWACNMTTAIEFWNGSAKNYATSKIVSKMDGCGSDGEALVFETQTAGQTWTTPKMTITNSGKVGIGTLVGMSGKLDVQDMNKADIHCYTTSFNPAAVWVANSASSYGIRIDAGGTGHIAAGAGLATPLNIINFHYNNNGQVWIGTLRQTTGAHTNYRLAVDGKLVSSEIIVTSTNWADFVFDPNYKLKSLDEVEKYYQVNRHLPEIPTASEITENGNDLGKTDALLLQKIEELTLYLVEQNKRNEKQQTEISELRSEIKDLKNRK